MPVLEYPDPSLAQGTLLPGLDLPLNYYPPYYDLKTARLFPSCLNAVDMSARRVWLPMKTLTELNMIACMNEFTDLKDWHRSPILSPQPKAHDTALLRSTGLTKAAAKWCIAELSEKALDLERINSIVVFEGDVVKSDDAVPPPVQEALKTAIARFQFETGGDSSDASSTPLGSGGERRAPVVKLVDPSMFPLVYGKTRCLVDEKTDLGNCVKLCGKGVVLPVPPLSQTRLVTRPSGFYECATNQFRERFQWLPCEVDVSGERARITSYINNLHPDYYPDLYDAIEDVIDNAIPLWNLSLAPLKAGARRERRIHYTKAEYDLTMENIPEARRPPRAADQSDEEYSATMRSFILNERRAIQPQPGKFAFRYRNKLVHPDCPLSAINLKRDFGKRGLQVIVKLTNVYLTPENPCFEGKPRWRGEGQMNEHICASAYYFYDNENITTHGFAFRQQSDITSLNVKHEPNDSQWLREVFGPDQTRSSVQPIGLVSVTSPAHPSRRLVTFPNILQRRFAPIRLADPTKPGHCTALVLYLVDPNIRIISTANVPCQQREWWADAIEGRSCRLANLPMELKWDIYDQVEEFPIGWEEARKLKELEEEEGRLVAQQERSFCAFKYAVRGD